MIKREVNVLRSWLALAAMIAVGACATQPSPTTVAERTPGPTPPEGAIYHNYCVAKYDDIPYNVSKWRTCGYVAEIPGFPLPLYSDAERHDVTTAHLTFCSEGSYNQATNRSSFVATFYYDETPDGSFDDFDSLTDANEPGVRVLGGDHIDAFEPVGGGSGELETIVDREVLVESADGSTMRFPSPEGTRWWVAWKDSPGGLQEIWVYELP